MPSTVFATLERTPRTDRASSELRAYARMEWGSDPFWAAHLGDHGTRRSRIRRWFRRGARNGHLGTPGKVPAVVPEMSPIPPHDECPHASAEDLGLGGSAEFLRCIRCGAVLVVHEGRRWRIDAVPTVEREVLVEP